MCRRLGTRICSTAKCPLTRRPYRAGVHGPKGPVRKVSEYGTQLLEKQKAKRLYGVLERQFKRYYTAATKKKGDTSVYLLNALETRLDNMVYRFGFAKTRAQARQLVTHGHVTVKGKVVDRPSYVVRINEVVALRKTPKEIEKRNALSWLAFDAATMSGKMTSTPEVSELPEQIGMRRIIEFYTR